MARTRLRGLEIAGIQMGIEVPETCAWDWPGGPIADFSCLPRNPEVHIGLRVGRLASGDLGGERYRLGAWTFEVARRGEDWLLGLERAGRREQLAHFDSEFREGEVVVSSETGRGSRFPLRSPLDEWITVHRTVARGGLCLNAAARAVDGQASIRLGAETASNPDRLRWMTPSVGLLGRHTVLIREEDGQPRSFRTPWSDSTDPALGRVATIRDLVVVEPTERPYRERLDPDVAAEMLVTHAVVPLCDEALLDRVLRNARRLGAEAAVLRIGERRTATASLDWRSVHALRASAPPQTGC